MATSCAGCCQRVSTIARLSQSVGSEAEPYAFFDDLVNDGLIGPFIEVVHELCALVSKESSVFKLDRTFHGSHASPD